jgi:para-aminobenzoate synthetase component 1
MSQNSSENQELINNLKNDPKEQSENVMIVDLVRNDLSQTAKKGSVKVEELFGIYPFKQLYQMISTVSSIKKDEFSSLDVILSCFPMGSMTGAPKKRAMELIDQYETSRRSLFSGTVGYFDPDGDFDFNVIIRSLFYDSNKKYLAYTVGSAITIQSDAEKEYDECLLKAKAIRDIFA